MTDGDCYRSPPPPSVAVEALGLTACFLLTLVLLPLVTLYIWHKERRDRTP